MVKITQETIVQSYKRIKNEIRRTTVLKGNLVSKSLPNPCDLYLKLEQNQLTGSFKIRGVMNKILSSSPDILKNGLFAASGGNHGRAVAYAGWKHSLPTTVYLPERTPPEKIELIRRWKAHTILSGQDLSESTDIGIKAAKEQNALFIHPFADPDIINGQGTLAVELFEQVSNIHTVIIAIGGGGLISGVGTYLKSINPNIKIIGVEPSGCPTLYNSFKEGRVVPVKEIHTIVGTLAIRCTSQINYELARACVDEIILVEDNEMLAASQWLWKEFGIAAEMSGAASLAGLLSGKIKTKPDEKICCLICGLGKDGLGDK